MESTSLTYNCISLAQQIPASVALSALSLEKRGSIAHFHMLDAILTGLIPPPTGVRNN